MKKTFLLFAIAGTAFFACNSGVDAGKANALRDEAIAIHDEIMPQVSRFDRTTMQIDSLLANLSALEAEHPGLDTVHTRAELTALKTNLNNANDVMSTWMHEFDPDVDFPTSEEREAYYADEVKKMEAMKIQFDEAAAQITEKLAQFL